MNKTNTINLRLTEKELEHIDKKADIAELKTKPIYSKNGDRGIHHQTRFFCR
ncbi:hypothetical protein ACFPYJ_26590 [Paenibacillus solisilvae]|uniref:Uncharacterized protein n=1 Tax=Paenibacillus solisilvae TaxID=2486751 RepID=A0ABW0W7B7_9BACL